MPTHTQWKIRQNIHSRRAQVVGKTNASSRDDIEFARLEAFANLLDSAFRIPGIGLRFGFDALLDLIPGIGDAIGAVLSLYIWQSARKLGVPRVTLVRMALNIGIDYVGGLLPIVGAIFDAYWKANIWNIALIKRHLNDPIRSRNARRSDLFFVLFMIAVFLLVISATTALAIWVFALLVHALH